MGLWGGLILQLTGLQSTGGFGWCRSIGWEGLYEKTLTFGKDERWLSPKLKKNVVNYSSSVRNACTGMVKCHIVCVHLGNFRKIEILGNYQHCRKRQQQVNAAVLRLPDSVKKRGGGLQACGPPVCAIWLLLVVPRTPPGSGLASSKRSAINQRTFIVFILNRLLPQREVCIFPFIHHHDWKLGMWMLGQP